jgi:hypothetical protein
MPTPHTPQPCPRWCTTDHTSEPARLATIHGAPVGQQVINADGRPHTHIGVYLAASSNLSTDARVSIAHSPLDGSASGTTMLDQRAASGIANLLRTLGHAEIADTLDRAVAALGGES